VPLYQAAIKAIKESGAIVKMSADDIFSAIEDHCKDGVDFITVHCGVTRSAIARLKEQGRITDVVSRGGAFTVGWILHNEQENPLYQYYNRLLEIAHRYDVTLSLGDGMRPGCLADATDHAQVEELLILGELVQRAWKAGVQVMVEGPGHIPLNQIETNVKLQKSICKGAPFYVLGPLVTDIGAGYDHITGAIGGAIAAMYGADSSATLHLPNTSPCRMLKTSAKVLLLPVSRAMLPILPRASKAPWIGISKWRTPAKHWIGKHRQN